MLEKSIAINIKLLKTKFPFVIYWALIISIVKGLGWLFICWMIFVSIGIMYRAIADGFDGDEAYLYMTLPISSKDLILGKVITISILFTICIIITIGILPAIFILAGDSFFWINSLVYDLVFIGISKLEIGILATLLPITFFIIYACFSLIAMNLYLFFHSKGIGKLNRMSVYLSVLIGSVIFSVWIGVNYLGCGFFLRNNISLLLIEFLNIVVNSAVSYLLLKKCDERLTYKFDL